MIQGKATHEEHVRATLRATNAVSRAQAEQIVAIESGEHDGDVEALDANGRRIPVQPPR